MDDFDFFDEIEEDYTSIEEAIQQDKEDSYNSGEYPEYSEEYSNSGIFTMEEEEYFEDEDDYEEYIPGQAHKYVSSLEEKELDVNTYKLDTTVDGLPLEDYFSPCQSNEYNYINDWVNSGWTGQLNLDLVLSKAIEDKASDIHIVGNQEIAFTILGDIVKQPRFGIPDEDTMHDVILGMLSHEANGVFVKDLEYDFSYKIRFGPYKDRRFRVNIGKSFGYNLATFRTINDKIPALEDLGLEKNVTDLFDSSTGVVLFAGATGSGKSTSLASIIRNIQLTKKLKIITVEKPIEYVYPYDGQSYIVQRSIPEDCLDFGFGLTSAMRSAPNIILIGEVRDRHEVDELLRAAETGHLSISTIHASNNVTTLNRIRSLFTGEEQRRILSTLGDTLRGIVNQVLVKTADGKSRLAIREVLKVDFRVRKLIASDNLAEIRRLQEEREETMEHLLLKAVLEGVVKLEDARDKAPDPTYFDEIAQAYISGH